jgi:CheY-like chemotaxis protein
MSELGLREENSEEKDNCFRDIRGSGRVLLENINSILDLSKIEAGKMEIVPENYHILTALHDTITVLRMRAKDKGLAFHTNIDETIPNTLYGDDLNINHIIMNLGGNAVKYTPSGSVTLSVTWEPEGTDGNLVIHLEDTGTGIRDEDIPQIFSSYGRLDDEGTRKVEGTGLGLPICQNLTQLMDGQIGVDSTYGVGSDFWVRIPQKVVDPTPCGPYREDTRRETEVSSHSFTAPEAVVLVVDDQPLNLKVCQGLLRPYEMQVYTARSGQEALRQMTQVWPDLVLMDHMMPDMDGLEVTRRIRDQGAKDPYFSVLPIIALTANAMKGVKEYYLENGFNDFISKPIELDHLDEVLRTWIPEDKQRDAVRPVGPLVPEPVPEELKDLPGIDSTQGMAYCGTVQIYRSTLILFRDQIDAKAKRMEEFRQAGNLPDYIVEVHSLKSAARWIGAAALGDLAESLEMAARAGNKTQVDRDTPTLLEQYRALKAPLLKLKEV